jgi:hypothetical protein
VSDPELDEDPDRHGSPTLVQVPDLGRPVDIGRQTVAVAAESGLQAGDFRVQNLHKE